MKASQKKRHQHKKRLHSEVLWIDRNASAMVWRGHSPSHPKLIHVGKALVPNIVFKDTVLGNKSRSMKTLT